MLARSPGSGLQGSQAPGPRSPPDPARPGSPAHRAALCPARGSGPGASPRLALPSSAFRILDPSPGSFATSPFVRFGFLVLHLGANRNEAPTRPLNRFRGSYRRCSPLSAPLHSPKASWLLLARFWDGWTDGRTDGWMQSGPMPCKARDPGLQGMDAPGMLRIGSLLLFPLLFSHLPSLPVHPSIYPFHPSIPPSISPPRLSIPQGAAAMRTDRGHTVPATVVARWRARWAGRGGVGGRWDPACGVRAG